MSKRRTRSKAQQVAATADDDKENEQDELAKYYKVDRRPP